MSAGPASRFRLSLAASLIVGGCAGDGEGQVSGSLFLRGCIEATATGAPPPFTLDPDYFVVDTVPAAAVGPNSNNTDPRIPNRMQIRLQRSSHRPELTDVFLLYLTDVDALRTRLGEAVPISAAPLMGPTVPLPSQAGPRVGATILLRGSCPITNVQPQLRGSGMAGDASFGVIFRELGFVPGEWVAADFAVAVEDDRGARLGRVPAERDAAGALRGSFRVQIQRSPSISFP